jgi:hypothetical protein
LKIPVLVGSWSEQDEAKILATLDPIATMAQIDRTALESLLGLRVEPVPYFPEEAHRLKAKIDWMVERSFSKVNA